MEKRRKDIKRLIIDIPFGLHTEVKLRATAQGLSLRRWLLKAIAARIKEEESYNNKMKD